MSDKLNRDSIWDAYPTKGGHVVLGQFVKHETLLERIEIGQVDNVFYQFPAFIGWKLYLSMAGNFEKNSEKHVDEFQRQLIGKTSCKKRVYSLIVDSGQEGFQTYFEDIISAYIFAFCALEAYVNMRLDSFKPTEIDYRDVEALVKKISPFSEIVSLKKDIIKYCSLEDKLFYILPLFMKKENIGLNKIKNFKLEFNRLQTVRNNLIHSDRMKIRTSNINGTFKTNVLWNNIIFRFKNNKASLIFHPAKFTEKIIQYIENECSIRN